MDKGEVIGLVRRYKELVRERFPMARVYLYGSFSKGNFSADSDIDVAVVVDSLKDDFFEDTPVLWKLRRRESNLIEPVLLTEDYSNPLFADIMRTGTLI